MYIPPWDITWNNKPIFQNSSPHFDNLNLCLNHCVKADDFLRQTYLRLVHEIRTDQFRENNVIVNSEFQSFTLITCNAWHKITFCNYVILADNYSFDKQCFTS